MALELTTLERRITDLKIVDGYSVHDASEAKNANATLGEVKEIAREVERAKREELQPLLVEEREIRSRYRPAEVMLDHAEDVVKRALLGFQQAEGRRLAYERAEAAKIAAAEADRMRAIAAAEREKAEKRAAALEAAGRIEAAGAAREAGEVKASAAEAIADVVPSTVVEPEATVLQGFSAQTKWVGSVRDVKAFLAWLASDSCPVDAAGFVEFRQLRLNDLAKLFRTNPIPGFKAEQTLIARRA